MKFGILGYGYVGKATHKGLLNDTKCIVYDITFASEKSTIYSADTVFVCIPTNDNNDLTTLISEISDIKKHNPLCDIVVRSTLPIGACEKLQRIVGNIIYIPEFLRERHWETDCLNRPLIVGYDGVTAPLPPWLSQEKIHRCSTQEAELVKMFSNNYAVMRIAFANLFYDLSQSVGADYNKVKEMYFDIQHKQTYMNVPGHDGTRGFGGKCLPKDLDFLIESLESNNINQDWFKHIRELNKLWTKKF